MIIKLTVKDRDIIVQDEYIRPTEGDVGTVSVSFDIQDDDFQNADKRVTFYNCGGGGIRFARLCGHARSSARGHHTRGILPYGNSVRFRQQTHR